jgi:hypothetical protein
MNMEHIVNSGLPILEKENKALIDGKLVRWYKVGDIFRPSDFKGSDDHDYLKECLITTLNQGLDVASYTSLVPGERVTRRSLDESDIRNLDFTTSTLFLKVEDKTIRLNELSKADHTGLGRNAEIVRGDFVADRAQGQQAVRGLAKFFGSIKNLFRTSSSGNSNWLPEDQRSFDHANEQRRREGNN